MPTYQYACRACGHSFEVVQPMTDEPLRECPRCGGELRKVYAPPAIAFRGSGFYATDHGKRAESTKEGSGGASGEGGARKDSPGDKGSKGTAAPAPPAGDRKGGPDRKRGSGGDGT
jgi:putative FmdB family regulatory protein